MKSRLSRLYYKLRYSIGFYPTIIAIGYFVLAFGVITLPSSFLWDSLRPVIEWTEFFRVWNDKAVLSTLITGIITFIALSFAMVMVVLSNVSTTYSPKLLLGLVTEKTHQVVLGNYIGAIIYCLMLLLRMPNGESHHFYDMAVILGSVMGIWCLVLFIVFIHKISVSVQISDITEKIYNETKTELYKRQKAEETSQPHRQASVDETIMPRYVFPSRTSGYLQRIDTHDLVKIASAHDLVIRVHPYLGDFVVKDSPFFACTKDCEKIDPMVREEIYNTFTYFPGEKIEINERYGFTQLMEIAIKALSPGINDPGTACICIDYLTDLFVLWQRLRHLDVYYDESQSPRLITKSLNFETLFNICFGPIRRYGKEDLLVANKLLQSFKTLAHFDRNERRYRKLLNDEALSVIKEMEKSSSNRCDLSFLHERISEMSEDPEGYFSLSLNLSSS